MYHVFVSYLDAVALRSERMSRLSEFASSTNGTESIPLVCDGPAFSSTSQLPFQQMNSVSESRQCYTCKQYFNQLHHFYFQLCPSCADLNWLKRNQTCDLNGKIALLTGGRVKIGFHVGLKLLRTGAVLLVTTRFPRDCVKRYAEEKDFVIWQDRLHVLGLDLRDLVGIEELVRYIERKFERVDMVIHNACQTVRRPPLYYRHLLKEEMVPLSELKPELRSILSCDAECWQAPGSVPCPTIQANNDEMVLVDNEKDRDTMTVFSASSSGSVAADSDAGNIRLNPALRAMIPLLEEDHRASDLHFPSGLLDHNKSQIDLRPSNSWVLPIG